MKAIFGNPEEELILYRTATAHQPRPLDPETLLLFYFDLEELAVLTEEELYHLIATRDDVDQTPDNSSHVAEDLLDRIRRKLKEPRNTKEGQLNPFNHSSR